MKKAYLFVISAIGLVVLAISLLGLFSACKAKKDQTPETGKKVEIYSLDQLKPILGEAGEDSSGAVDVTGDSRELVLSYRYYNPQRKDYDDGLVKDLAPKIEALYRNFKNLNRTVFQVAVNDPQVPGKWKAYVSFAVHRNLVEKIEWANILTDDFFKNVIDLKRFD